MGRVVDVGRADAGEVLIVFLLYACYQPLRFSIEDPERQARYAAVFSVVAGAFVPLNFMAVRMAQSLRAPARALDDRRVDARVDAADVPGVPDRGGRAAARSARVVTNRRPRRAPCSPAARISRSTCRREHRCPVDPALAAHAACRPCGPHTAPARSSGQCAPGRSRRAPASSRTARADGVRFLCGVVAVRGDRAHHAR